MARRNVDLVIRARNEAQNALNSINSALDEFNQRQQTVQQTAAGTDARLESLGQTFAELGSALGSLGATGRVNQELAKVREEIVRVEAAIEKSKGEVTEYGQSLERTTRQTERLASAQAKAAADLERAEQAFRGSENAQDRLNAATNRARRSQEQFARRQERLSGIIDRANQRLTRAQERYDRLGQAITRTAQPSASLVRRLGEAQQAVNRISGEIAEYVDEQRLLAEASEQAANSVTRANVSYGQQAATLERNRAALERAQQAQTEAAAAAKISADEQARLAQAADRTANRLAAQEQELERAKGAYQEISGVVRSTGDALDQLDRRARVSILQGFREQVTRVREARQAYRELSAEAARLGREIAQTEQPTREQIRAFREYREVAARARQEFRAQGQALSNLRALLRQTGGDVSEINARFRTFRSTLEQSRRGYTELRSAANAAAGAARAAAQAQQQSLRTTARQVVTQRSLNAALRQGTRQTSLFSQAIRRFYGDTRVALSFTQRLRGEVLSLIAAYGGIFAVIEGVRGVVNAFQDLEAAQNRLRTIFDGDELAVTAELDFIRRNARRLGIEFGVLAQEYSKFAVATRGTNLEGEATRRIFRSVAEAGRVNKLTIDQLRGTFVALTQIVSKGTVAMEELRQQLGDRLPGALQILAAGLDISTEELTKLVENGQISSDALINFAEELDRRFGDQLPAALESTTTAIGRFQNAIFEAFLTIGQGGAIQGFTDLINDLTEALDSAQVEDFLSRVGVALQQLFNLLGLLVRNWDLLIVAITTFLGLKIAPFVVALVATLGRLPAILRLARIRTASFRAGLVGLRTAATATTTALAALRGVLTALLSSTGIGLLVVAVSTALGLWATRTTEATEALVAHQKILEQVRNAYDEVGKSVQDIRDRVKDISEIQLRANVDQFKKDLREAEQALQAVIPFGQRGRFVGENNPLRDFQNLINAFVSGEVEAEEFEDRLLGIQEKYEDIVPITNEFLETIRKAAEAVDDKRQVLQEAEDTLTTFTGETEAAQEAVDRLTGAAEEAGDALAREAVRAARFEEALAALRAQIPGVADELEKLDEQRALEKLRDDALALAKNTDQAVRVLQEYQRVVNSLELDEVLSGDLADRIIAAESGGRAGAANPQSSALGLGQFIESTWLDLFERYFPERADALSRSQILALRTDPRFARQMVDIYIAELVKQLQQGGIPVTDANISLSYFLGAGGAADVIRAAPGTVVNEILPQNVIAANQGVLDGRTREEVLRWAAARVDLTEQELSARQALNTVEQRQNEERRRESERLAKERADERQATQERLTDLEFEIEQQRLKNNDKEREAAIEAEVRDAKRDNAAITEEELQRVRDLAGERFDLANAEKLANLEREKARKIEQEINELVTLQTSLRSLLEEQLARGESAEAVAQTREQLNGVNQQLQEAVANALLLLQTFDQTDPAVASVTTRLRELKLAGVDAATGIFVTFDQVSNAFQGAFTNSVLSFAEALAEGESATRALGDAFRQFASEFLRSIAQMILQQLALNLAKAVGRSFGFGVAHGGGIVGNQGARRTLDASVLNYAIRYHQGGVAGLRPGEVPTILQRGEEVLTTDDPRHVFNGGGAAGAGETTGVGGVKIVNAIDGASFVEEGLRSARGEQAFLNFMSSNRSSVRGALGV